MALTANLMHLEHLARSQEQTDECRRIWMPFVVKPTVISPFQPCLTSKIRLRLLVSVGYCRTCSLDIYAPLYGILHGSLHHNHCRESTPVCIHCQLICNNHQLLKGLYALSSTTCHFILVNIRHWSCSNLQWSFVQNNVRTCTLEHELKTIRRTCSINI